MTSGESAASVRVESWAPKRRKNLVTLGTWEECAFHVSLRNKDKPEDPLEVPLFGDSFPYHCLPHWYVCLHLCACYVCVLLVPCL